MQRYGSARCPGSDSRFDATAPSSANGLTASTARSLGRRRKLLAPFRRHDLDQLTVGIPDVHRLTPVARRALALPEDLAAVLLDLVQQGGDVLDREGEVRQSRGIELPRLEQLLGPRVSEVHEVQDEIRAPQIGRRELAR